MASRVPGVLGAFEEIDAATDAIHALRARGHGDLTVYSAAPNHELEEALAQPKSWVRLFTLVGGLTGCASGFGMTLWMSYDWPLLVGGKPIGAIPPYVVLAFELTILFGSLFTVAGMIILSIMKSGIFAPCGPQEAEAIVRLMRDAGSVEVQHEAA
ncbi:MAG: DUF3341 domain-containing protein [Gemmatimonadales bacterium]|nr:DUF3341 domain-containing protein [Gemmatimonadales bacterium]